jgi:xylan 1,4-beta-xylosidase
LICWSRTPTRRRLTGAWREGIAVGRAYELLRADVQQHLATLQSQIGFRYCRFHGLFHDDVQPVVRGPDGRIRTQWGQVGKVFDFLLSIGLKPFVELGPMPSAMASGTETFFYWRMNITPPKHWEEWEELVDSFARWAIRRYGADEVRSWWFEVWNEPNLSAFWSGTFEEYFQLYQASARALRRVDPLLRVGGPASAEGGWLEPFLSGPAKTEPADFVSTHVYPMNEFGTIRNRQESPFEPGRFMLDRVK